MTVVKQFEGVIKKMPALLERLQSSPAITRANLTSVPQKGVYVYYEGKTPLYVGRSRRMRTRLLEHSRPSSGHTAATFAFILAQKEYKPPKGQVAAMHRKQLEDTPAFAEIYRASKERVAKMAIRVVEVDNPVEQTIFEVYAATILETPYNVFDTH